MDRQGMTQQMPGSGAPRPGQPGMGTGNVPYAKGMISGNFGQKNMGGSPSPGGSQIQPTPGPSSPAAPSSPSPPQGAAPGLGMAMGMAGSQTPFLQPQFLFEVYAAIMNSFLQAAQGDGLPWGYTY